MYILRGAARIGFVGDENVERSLNGSRSRRVRGRIWMRCMHGMGSERPVQGDEEKANLSHLCLFCPTSIALLCSIVGTVPVAVHARLPVILAV